MIDGGFHPDVKAVRRKIEIPSASATFGIFSLELFRL